MSIAELHDAIAVELSRNVRRIKILMTDVESSEAYCAAINYDDNLGYGQD